MMSKELETHIFLRAVCAVVIGIVGLGLTVVAACKVIFSG